jgi:sulfur transfer complex TusBCD TusB component (DsrH family)
MTESDHFVLWLDGFMHACNGKPSTKQLKEISAMLERVKSRLDPPTIVKADAYAVKQLNS